MIENCDDEEAKQKECCMMKDKGPDDEEAKECDKGPDDEEAKEWDKGPDDEEAKECDSVELTKIKPLLEDNTFAVPEEDLCEDTSGEKL